MQTTDKCELSHGSLNKRENWRETERKSSEGEREIYSKQMPVRQRAMSETEQGQMKREMKEGCLAGGG